MQLNRQQDFLVISGWVFVCVLGGGGEGGGFLARVKLFLSLHRYILIRSEGIIKSYPLVKTQGYQMPCYITAMVPGPTMNVRVSISRPHKTFYKKQNECTPAHSCSQPFISPAHNSSGITNGQVSGLISISKSSMYDVCDD